MQSVKRRGRRGAAWVTGFLIALTVLSVLLMHSVTPVTSMSGDHAPMTSTPSVDSSVPTALGGHDCPSAHHMMHPCVGVAVSWPALTLPTVTVQLDLSPTPVAGTRGCTDYPYERAPPWALWELDRSVTLRV